MSTQRSPQPAGNVQELPAAQTSPHRSGFWAAAFAFLIVMAFATLPSPLYGLYRVRDNLSVIKDFVPQPGRGFRLAYDILY